MKQTKRFLLMAAMLLSSLAASASYFHLVEVNGIYYHLYWTTYQAEVTSGTTEYSGSITIPATVTYEGMIYSVTSIEDGAFFGCSSLTAVTIPENVTSIGDNAFRGCSSLTSITIPKSVSSIGFGVSAGCTSLNTIIVAEGNTIFDSRGGCNAIIETNSNTLIAGCATTIIPESVTSIGSHAFSGHTSLTSITIPKSVTSIGWYAFCGCSSLSSITIPESVTSIGMEAFEECSSLTSITIPEGVTNIEMGAFFHCSSLTTIVLPSTLIFIDQLAFAGCPEQIDVYCYAEIVPTACLDVFPDLYSYKSTLHVPTSALESYKTTEPWCYFGTIVPLANEDTSVEQMTIDNSPLVIYDLSGRRVENPEKGIYIVNGKKVAIK